MEALRLKCIYNSKEVVAVSRTGWRFKATTSVGINFRHSKKAVEWPVHIYPNPAKDQATLSYTIAEDGIFEVYDAFGEKQSIHKLQGKAHEYIFDTSKLANGVYYYKVTCCDENVHTGKLIITR